jgi:phospholipid/cholesterol/gamma-HCH transport system substrate-binding protein
MEWKVGLFVLIGLILTGMMVMRFSKGTGLSGTYTLKLVARNAGGIIPGANVLMSGVPVGSVSEIILAPDGTQVTMLSRIYDRFQISTNAVWSVQTVGLLGDRFIAVSPGPSPEGAKLTFLEEGATVRVQEAFDIAQVAESAAGLMDRLSGTVEQLSNAVVRLDNTVLSETTLTNLASTVANLREVSGEAKGAVGDVRMFVQTNTAPLSAAISNLNLFSVNLKEGAAELRDLVATNRPGIARSIENVERATVRADKLLAQAEAGEGLAGKLLSDQQLGVHVSLMASNLGVFSSNLNSRGLWGVIRKPKNK